MFPFFYPWQWFTHLSGGSCPFYHIALCMLGSLLLTISLRVRDVWQRRSSTSHLSPRNLPDSLGALWLYVRLREDMYSRVIAAAVLPKTKRGRKKRREERKGMHSLWISHFGLWPGTHPITFKLAAACKTLHISHRVPHPLQGPYAPTTTLINQPLVKRKKRSGAPLSSYHSRSHSLWSPQTPHRMLTVHHTTNMQLG